jgi:myosin heavy subunit
LDENFTKIEEQESTIRSLEQQIEDLKQEHKDALEEEKATWDNKVQELQTRNEELDKQLQEVRAYIKEKEEVQAELEGLRTKLQETEEAHAREISSLDRKKAIEIDQLKKDMLTKIRETRDTLRLKTKDQLDTTTKRTIMENEQMNTELHFQSRETERLLDKNQALLEENAQLRRNLQIHKELEDELARRTHVYQKLIRKLHQKLKALATEESRESLEASRDDEDGKAMVSRREIDGETDQAARENADRLSKEVEGLQNTLHMVRFEFAQYRRDHATLTQLQDVSTRLVIAALYDLKNQYDSGPFPPSSYDENAQSSFADMTPKQKEYFFRMLLEKLNQSLCTTCCPAGPAQATSRELNLNSSSLPPIGKGQGTSRELALGGASADGGNLTQFLHSITSKGQYSAMPVDMETKATQTGTESSDPCYKDGLWNANSRSMHSDIPRIAPHHVRGEVRGWGNKAATQASSRSQRRNR